MIETSTPQKLKEAVKPLDLPLLVKIDTEIVLLLERPLNYTFDETAGVILHSPQKNKIGKYLSKLRLSGLVPYEHPVEIKNGSYKEELLDV